MRATKIKGRGKRTVKVPIDKGHYARKTVWLTLACLLFVPHFILVGASILDEQLLLLGERMVVWAHPCLYVRRDK